MLGVIASILLVSGIAMGGRGLFVWNHCGYDCSAISVLGLSATGSMFVGMVLAILGIGLFLSILIEKGR
jgi:hypothetical protein